MRKFLIKEDGYVFVLMLLFMPIFIGFSMLIIDIGRGNNTHSDLQAAADAMALAGALELDQSPGAIAEAQAAMQTIQNTVRFVSVDTPMTGEILQYTNDATNDYEVIFLRDLPASDDTPIDQAWVNGNATLDDLEARYVYVRAEAPRNLETIFLNPATLLGEATPIAASAVATAATVICDFPPVYMCNPFEDETPPTATGEDATLPATSYYEKYQRQRLTGLYNSGALHGRMVRIHPSGGQSERPGNFNFLQVGGSSSANTIREYFAGASVPLCVNAGAVETKPGAAVAIRQGINTRFDEYLGQFNNGNQPFLQPAPNVRKGYLEPSGNVCNAAVNYEDIVEDGVTVPKTFGLTVNNTMALPGNPNGIIDPVTGEVILADGSSVGVGNWPLDDYLIVNYRSLPGGNGFDLETGDVVGTLDSTDIENVIDNFGSAHVSLTSLSALDPDIAGTAFEQLLIGEETAGVSYNTARDFDAAGGTPNTYLPSRYDVYRFEMAYTTNVRGRTHGTTWTNAPLHFHNSYFREDDSGGFPTTNFTLSESGAPMCGDNKGVVSLPTTPSVNDAVSRAFDGTDRRVIPIAIIDCRAPYNTGQGQTQLRVNRFAKAFLVRPMEANGASTCSKADEDAGICSKDGTIDIEIVGLQGSNIGQEVEDVTIRESFLVR